MLGASPKVRSTTVFSNSRLADRQYGRRRPLELEVSARISEGIAPVTDCKSGGP